MSYLNQQTGYYELPAGTKIYLNSSYRHGRYCLGHLVVDTCVKKNLVGKAENTDCSLSAGVCWFELSCVYRFLEPTDYGRDFVSDRSAYSKFYFKPNGDRAFYLEDHDFACRYPSAQGVLW